MMPSPHEHTDFLGSDEDRLVSDPLSDEFVEVSRSVFLVRVPFLALTSFPSISTALDRSSQEEQRDLLGA